MKILITFLSGLGNGVLFEPTLRAIKSSFPNSKINFLIREKIIADLYQDTGLADQFFLYQEDSSFLEKIRPLREILRKKYDYLISTSPNPHLKEAGVVFLTRAKTKVGYRSNSWTDGLFDRLAVYTERIHEVECRLRLVRKIGIEIEDKRPKIYISQNTKNYLESVKGLIIGMHPGCSETLKFKRWPAEKFVETSDILIEKYNAKIVLFGGPEEIDLSQEIGKIMRHRPLILTGRTSIKETALAIRECDLFVTNDSGLMHVASAVDVPTVAIFGPTNSIKNAPLAEKNVVLKKGESVKEVSVEDVVKAVDRIL